MLEEKTLIARLLAFSPETPIIIASYRDIRFVPLRAREGLRLLALGRRPLPGRAFGSSVRDSCRKARCRGRPHRPCPAPATRPPSIRRARLPTAGFPWRPGADAASGPTGRPP